MNRPLAAPEMLVHRHMQPGASLLAILHAIQDEAGFVPPACIAPLAQALHVSRAEVHGVLTYYTHFRTTPAARVTIQLCRAEACQSMGSAALVAHAESRIGCRIDTTPPENVALESAYCLGLCAQAPALTLNGAPHAKVSPEKFDALYTEASANHLI